MCKYIGSTHVAPGWGCCRCHHYNGLQRENCRNCGERRHELSIPPDLWRCSICGFGFESPLESCPSCAADAGVAS